jgi:hypothetical protein
MNSISRTLKDRSTKIITSVNKDQKLLEEAYQTVYQRHGEPLYFGPPERKEKFESWLILLDHEVHEDGSVSIQEDVNLSYLQIQRLPFNFKNVKGDFMCYMDNLTSLQGAPISVGGDFFCYYNNLSSLKGAPISVEGSFNCKFNKLASLQGAPEKIGGQFLSSQFSDKDYRDFIKHEKYVKGKLEKDFDIDLKDF